MKKAQCGTALPVLEPGLMTWWLLEGNGKPKGTCHGNWGLIRMYKGEALGDSLVIGRERKMEQKRV